MELTGIYWRHKPEKNNISEFFPLSDLLSKCPFHFKKYVLLRHTNAKDNSRSGGNWREDVDENEYPLRKN